MVQERVMYTPNQANQMIEKIKSGRVYNIRGTPAIAIIAGSRNVCFLVNTQAYNLKIMDHIRTECHGMCAKSIPGSPPWYDVKHEMEFMCMSIPRKTLAAESAMGSFCRKSKRSKTYITTMNKLDGYRNYCNQDLLQPIITRHVAKYSKKGIKKS